MLKPTEIKEKIQVFIHPSTPAIPLQLTSTHLSTALLLFVCPDGIGCRVSPAKRCGFAVWNKPGSCCESHSCLLPPPVLWVPWKLKRSRHPALGSGSDTASVSTPCKTDSALTDEHFVIILSRRDLSKNLKPKMWNVTKICKMRCLV